MTTFYGPYFSHHYTFYKLQSFSPLHILFDLSSNQNQKPINFFCTFGCQSCFCKPAFFQKQIIYDFLAGSNYPDSPHLQEVMKFATQISPLLILYKMTAPTETPNLYIKKNSIYQFKKNICILI